jgi:hypothetical protein
MKEIRVRGLEKRSAVVRGPTWAKHGSPLQPGDGPQHPLLVLWVQAVGQTVGVHRVEESPVWAQGLGGVGG